MISQGVDFVDTFYQLEPLKERVAKSLSQRSDDPKALAQRGEIALSEGLVDQAIADIRSAYQLNPSPSNLTLMIAALERRGAQEFRQISRRFAQIAAGNQASRGSRRLSFENWLWACKKMAAMPRR